MVLVAIRLCLFLNLAIKVVVADVFCYTCALAIIYIPCICAGSSLFMKSIHIENAKTYMLKNWIVLKEKSGLFKQKVCETVSSTYVYYRESWLWCFLLCSWMFVSEPKVCRYKSHSYMQLEWQTDKKNNKSSITLY